MRSPRRRALVRETFERRPDACEAPGPVTGPGENSASLSFDQSNVAGARSLG